MSLYGQYAEDCSRCCCRQKRVKIITGARDLTANEYVERLREDKQRKGEAEEEKMKEERKCIRD